MRPIWWWLAATALADPGLPRPTGIAGTPADDVAHKLQAAVDDADWQKTGAVAWTFGPRRHLWDKARMFDRVDIGDDDVLLDLTTRTGIVTHAGQPVTGDAATTALSDAWKAWVNDSFWLDPIAKLFDAGTTRELVHDADGDGLLVTYHSGGVTPGDAYLWRWGADGRPTSWRMWVSVVPDGGRPVSWDGWVTLATGAVVSTLHHIGDHDLQLTDVRGGARLSDLESPDPFASIAKR